MKTNGKKKNNHVFRTSTCPVSWKPDKLVFSMHEVDSVAAFVSTGSQKGQAETSTAQQPITSFHPSIFTTFCPMQGCGGSGAYPSYTLKRRVDSGRLVGYCRANTKT